MEIPAFVPLLRPFGVGVGGSADALAPLCLVFGLVFLAQLLQFGLHQPPSVLVLPLFGLLPTGHGCLLRVLDPGHVHLLSEGPHHVGRALLVPLHLLVLVWQRGILLPL